LTVAKKRNGGSKALAHIKITRPVLPRVQPAEFAAALGAEPCGQRPSILGIYFWEYAPKQAWWWARKFKKHAHPAVVGAMIRLGNCFDLLDPKNVAALKAVHQSLTAKMEVDGLEVPANERHHHNLDRAVFNFLYLQAETAGTPIDSARAVYVPKSTTKRVWRGSWIYDEAHIQICVRNPENILAVWHVRPDGRYGKQAQEAAKEPG